LIKFRNLDKSLVKKKHTSEFYPYPPYLNMFRGKPAIIKFDWLITPNYRSS